MYSTFLKDCMFNVFWVKTKVTKCLCCHEKPVSRENWYHINQLENFMRYIR